MTTTHFATAAEFRRWLEKNHASAAELQVGFYTKASGKAGMTYPEAVEEALCFGWIDGIIRKIDADTYTHRFTPRKPGSIWSTLNVARAERLIRAGRMRPAGLAAFRARSAKKTGVYSFEKRPEKLPAAFEKLFRADPTAWAGWKKFPPGYRRTAIHWVTSAKQAETRGRRLARLIALTSRGVRLDGK